MLLTPRLVSGARQHELIYYPVVDGFLRTVTIRESEIKCEGINFLLSDGEAAGQEVWHTHLHVTPRFEGDGFGFKRTEKNLKKPTRNELNQIAKKIREKIEVCSTS